MAWAFMVMEPAAPSRTRRAEPSLKTRAMRLLARREHSREELRRKLAPKVQEGEDLESVLDELSRCGWLSDARFAEQSVRAKAKRYGPAAIAHQLRAKGVEEEAIAKAFRAAGEEGASHLDAVWRSRFKLPPACDRERARQVRFLQGRGFALEAILKFIRGLP
jgi:regulatory protein